MFPHDVILKGGRVTLRPMTDGDIPLVHSWWKKPEVILLSEGTEGITWDNIDDVREVIDKISQEGYVFLIEHSGRPIGDCWLQRMNLTEILTRFPGKDLRRIDISIGEQSLWGQGMGTEAIQLLTAFGFNQERADAIFGCGISSDNPRSFKAFRKCGYSLMDEQERFFKGRMITERNVIQLRSMPGNGMVLDGELAITPASGIGEETVLSIYEEAAKWLKAQGVKQWEDSPRAGRLSEYFREGIERGNIYIIKVGNEKVGMFRLSWGERFDGRVWAGHPGPAAYLHTLAIRRNVAGRGIGAKVVDRAVKVAHGMGCPLRLDCGADNARLRRYYEEFGFRASGEAELDNYHLVRYELLPPC